MSSEKPENNIYVTNSSQNYLRHRCYEIPDSFETSALIDMIAERLGEQAKVIVKEIEPRKKWRIQARNKGGYISRFMKRRPELMLIAIELQEGRLFIGVNHAEKVQPAEAESGDDPGAFKWVTSMAAEVTADITDAAVSGLTDLWRETKTESAIYDSIEQYIINAWQNIRGDILNIKEAFRSRFIQNMSGIERVWLASFLHPGEIILAWLKTGTSVPGNKYAGWRYLLTSENSLLAGFSRTRFIQVHELPSESLSFSDSTGKKTVNVGGMEFKTLSENQALFEEIAELPEKNRIERIRQAARLNYIHHKTEYDRMVYTFNIMERVVRLTGEFDDELSLMMIKLYRDLPKNSRKNPSIVPAMIERYTELGVIVNKLSESTVPERLRDWAEYWTLTPLEQIALARSMQNYRPKDSEIARRLKPMIEANRNNADRDDSPLAVALDILYAQNLILGEHYREAEQILEKRLANLPDESYLDLLPHGNSDLTRGEGGQELRIKILTLLSYARGSINKPDPETVIRLACLQPLVAERLEQCAMIGDEDIKPRATIILKGLGKKGLLLSDEEGAPIKTGQAFPLPAEYIENRLRHPAGREGTALRKLQNFIAAKKQPDHALLKTYTKRVNSSEHPEIVSAIVDGTLILGLASVEAYISYGELNTGIRSYEGNPPFLLIGSDHLNPQSDYYLKLIEFRFQIGAELAHLRYKHKRITSQEIWEGAFNKVMSVIEFFPVIGGYMGKIGRFGKAAGHAADVAKQLKKIQNYVNQAREISNTVQGLYQTPPGNRFGSMRSDRERDLINAFREMQFTADRAALVICGNPLAAANSMIKVSSMLNSQLHLAQEYGLTVFLSRTDEEGNIMFQDLAIRLASLFSFYLSQDYAVLRKAAFIG